MEKQTRLDFSRRQAEAYAGTVLEKMFSCAVENIRFIGGGSFGFVYEATIDKPPYTVIMKGFLVAGVCELESSELQLLAQDSVVKIPEVYFTFTGTPECPMHFLCMEKVSGTNCFTDFKKLLLPKKEKAAFAQTVAGMARHWHMRTNDKFGPIDNAVYDTWLDYYKPVAAGILEEARRMTQNGRFEKYALAVMERSWEAFDTIFSEPVEHAGLIHGDLHVMNIMSDKKLRVTAVIDPQDSMWADPEYEIFQFRNMTGNLFGLYRTYKQNYPVSANCDVKTAFYALYHEADFYFRTDRRIHEYLPVFALRMKRELRRAGL